MLMLRALQLIAIIEQRSPQHDRLLDKAPSIAESRSEPAASRTMAWNWRL